MATLLPLPPQSTRSIVLLWIFLLHLWSCYCFSVLGCAAASAEVPFMYLKKSCRCAERCPILPVRPVARPSNHRLAALRECSTLPPTQHCHQPNTTYPQLEANTDAMPHQTQQPLRVSRLQLWPLTEQPLHSQAGSETNACCVVTGCLCTGCCPSKFTFTQVWVRRGWSTRVATSTTVQLLLSGPAADEKAVLGRWQCWVGGSVGWVAVLGGWQC